MNYCMKTLNDSYLILTVLEEENDLVNITSENFSYPGVYINLF